jgi:hypothetical protein
MGNIVEDVKRFKRNRNDRIRGGKGIGIILDSSGSVKKLKKWAAIASRIIAGNKTMWENPSVPLGFKRTLEQERSISGGYEKRVYIIVI